MPKAYKPKKKKTNCENKQKKNQTKLFLSWACMYAKKIVNKIPTAMTLHSIVGTLNVISNGIFSRRQNECRQINKFF